MTVGAHLHCPQCGYDLHGIPEERCPECGFGFDKAGALAVSAVENERAFAAARAVIAISAMSAVCAGAALIDLPTMITLPGLVAIALWIVGRFCAPRPPRAFDGFLRAIVVWAAVVVVTFPLFSIVPIAAPTCAVIFGVCAWCVCLHRRVGYAYAELNLSEALRRELRLHSRAALALLLSASALTFACLV